MLGWNQKGKRMDLLILGIIGMLFGLTWLLVKGINRL